MATRTRSERAGLEPKLSAALTRRLIAWVLVAGFCAVGMARPVYADYTVPVIGRITYFQAILLIVAVLGVGTLLRKAGERERSVSRTMCRIVIAYLLYEALLVIPVSLWIGAPKVAQIVTAMTVRLSWLLLPVMLTICADERAKRLASLALLVAAAALVAWGVFAVATGGGGYYMEFGEVRYRILPGIGALLIAWPFVLGVSGVTRSRYTIALLALSGIGIVLVNHRSGFIAFALAGLVCLLMSGRARRLVPALIPIVLVGAIVTVLWGDQLSKMLSYTWAHLFDTRSATATDRMQRWSLAWSFFVAHPFTDYIWTWRYYLVRVAQAYPPHNAFLEVAGREGIAGLAFYGSMLTAAVRGSWSWLKRDAEIRALIGWLIVYIAFSLLNANHYLTTSMPLLVAALAALAARIDHLRRRSAPDAEPAAAAGAHA